MIPKEEEEIVKKIKTAFSYDQLASLSATTLGMAYLLGDFTLKTTPRELMDKETVYALAQTFNLIKVFKEVLSPESCTTPVIGTVYMPKIPEGIGIGDEDFEKRIVIMVEYLYKKLVEEGKIEAAK